MRNGIEFKTSSRIRYFPNEGFSLSLNENAMMHMSASMTSAIHEAPEFLRKFEAKTRTVELSAPVWLEMLEKSALTPKLLVTPQSSATYKTMRKRARMETEELIRLFEKASTDRMSMKRISEIFLHRIREQLKIAAEENHIVLLYVQAGLACNIGGNQYEYEHQPHGGTEIQQPECGKCGSGREEEH